MADEQLTWQGVISENGLAKNGKNLRIVGQANGKKFYFNLGADKGPGPQVGMTVELQYRVSNWQTKEGQPRSDNWIGNWRPIQASLPEVRRHNGADTIPTVLEQFVKETVAGWAHAGQLGMDAKSVHDAIRACIAGWRAAKGDDKPTVPATGPAEDPPWEDAPPPKSADDYGAQF